MSLAPTLAQIRAQVAAVRAKSSTARVIAIQAPLSATTGDSLRVDGEEIAIARCATVLEIRERLIGHDGKGPPLVVLTPLEENELGTDILARLAKRHLFRIQPWQLVKDRFRARHIDPRLVERHQWVARALLETEPEGGHPPAPSGFLEAELAWRILFESLLGLPDGRRDPESLLEWSVDDPDSRKLAGISDEIRAGLSKAVQETAGELAGRIFETAAANSKDALAVGLVARVLYDPAAVGDPVAIKASGRLESYLDAGTLDDVRAQAWAAAVETVLERRLARDPGWMASFQARVQRGDRLLDSLGAPELAHRSRFLATAYDQRIRRFAAELIAFLEDEGNAVPSASFWEAGDAVLDHRLAARDEGRSGPVAMALRLVRWLAERRAKAPPRAGSFAQAAQAYRQEESFVDQARMRIWESDILESSLRQAYTRLSEVVGVERERRNRDFGELFASWSRTGSHDKSLLGVEEVHDKIVVPLARQRPVLLAVIDGMSVPVFRELQNDLIERGWVEFVQREDGVRPPVIAALPSLTEVSRTSLLCGKLVTGQQNIERAGFGKHPGLVDCSEPSKPPVLFHKGELRISGAVGLPPNVRDEIADPHRRVVGVVINAVDDHLAKGEQVRVDWTAHRIRPLKELLQAAAEAERAVVIVSDHGHVLEHHTESRVQGESDRWREDDGKPAADEVVMEGPRVLLGAGGRLIAPWSERVRFGSKKNGYHGGVSPQEIVIPLAVFLPAGLALEGWHEAPPELPDWWEAPLVAEFIPPAAVAPVVAPVVVRPAPPKPGETGRLFPSEEEQARAAADRAAIAARVGSSAGGTRAAAEWIDALLASERLAAQRSKAARTHLPDERLREILAALDERGGKLTRAALAKRLGVPPLRVGGIVSALRRVLNVEGYAVLSVDEASDTVVLDRPLLETQFGLGKDEA